jgi:hypothetical protein
MVMLWMEASDVAWHYIAPGMRQQNAFIASFIGRLRDECLDEPLFSFSPPGRRTTRRTTAFDARIPHTAGVPKPAHRLCRQPGNGQNFNRAQLSRTRHTTRAERLG